jgi:hypothetical protein
MAWQPASMVAITTTPSRAEEYARMNIDPANTRPMSGTLAPTLDERTASLVKSQ